MAIYHLSAKLFSRGNNHSAVAAAAYRSAEKLYDERQDKTLDYSRKQRVLHTEIIAPDIVPKWATEREALWNNVEAAEKRKDAQVAREVEVALPRELPPDAHQILIREFVQNEFISRGMIADVAIHESIAGDGATNPHAHIMLTTREITLEGFGKKNRDWNRKELMEAWRESWATHTNQYLEAIHSDQRI
ncbi:MobA/MobL family protein, partial [candidate division KSB1 bacterium]|nr:MobA/MobL family protein [candidate division KSB1 bacterium]